MEVTLNGILFEPALLLTLVTLVLLISRGCNKQRRKVEMYFENQTWYTFLSQIGKFLFTLCMQFAGSKCQSKSLIKWAHKLHLERDVNLATTSEWATMHRLDLSPPRHEWLKTIYSLETVLEVGTYHWRSTKCLYWPRLSSVPNLSKFLFLKVGWIAC